MKFLKENDFQIISGYLKNNKRLIISSGFLMIINVILMAPTPLITMYIIDNIIPEKNLKLLSIIIIGLFILLALNALVGYYLRLTFLKINTSFVYDLKLKIIDAFQSMPLRKIRELQTGYIMSRIQNDPQNLSGFFANSLLNIIKDLLILILGLGVIFWLHWKLALLTILVLPLFIYTIKYFSKKIQEASYAYFEMEAQSNKKLQESIVLLELFRYFSSTNFDLKRFGSKLLATIESLIKKSKLEFLSSSLTSLIGGLGPIIILWYGMSEVIKGNLNIGEIIAFSSFIAYIFGPSSRLTNINSEIQHSISALKRVNQILNSPEKNSQIFGKQKIENVDLVSLKNVSFKYDSQELFKNLNYTFPAGKITGILGESGSGKSTITKLLYGFEKVQNGDINFCGTTINELDIEYLRSKMAIVDQEPLLFSDTIAENMRLAKIDASEEEIQNAAKIANIHDFIMGLPEQYNTVVDEKSINLSVGQKQRIAIARAILKNPQILILDEFTSNLDLNTEDKLLTQLLPFLKERTTIIIAHKLKTLKSVDVLLKLENGILTTIDK